MVMHRTVIVKALWSPCDFFFSYLESLLYFQVTWNYEDYFKLVNYFICRVRAD